MITTWLKETGSFVMIIGNPCEYYALSVPRIRNRIPAVHDKDTPTQDVDLHEDTDDSRKDTTFL